MPILLLAIGLSLGPGGHVPAGLAQGGIDSTAIRRFWADLDVRWGDRDPDAFARLFTPDASFAVVDRNLWLEDRGAIHRHFVEQFGRQRPELRHLTRIERFRVLTTGLIAIDGEVRILDGRGNDAGEIRRLAITGVMVYGADGWRIQLIRAHTLSLPEERSPDRPGYRIEPRGQHP